MIPVAPARETASFDGRVRQPGAKHLGAQGAPVRAEQPYWRRALDDLGAAYDDTCAYLGIRLQKSTTFLTVDHFIPKSAAPHLAYEWSNLRLASQTVNTYKGEQSVPIDPFTVRLGEFALSLLTGEVVVGRTTRRAAVAETITVLRLNDARFVDDRAAYIDDFLMQQITRSHLKRWFPFGETELTRQGH